MVRRKNDTVPRILLVRMIVRVKCELKQKQFNGCKAYIFFSEIKLRDLYTC